jgi:hypothetical protein
VNNILTITLKDNGEFQGCKLNGRMRIEKVNLMPNFYGDWSGEPIVYCVLMVMIGWLGLTMRIFGSPDGAVMMENPAAMLE